MAVTVLAYRKFSSGGAIKFGWGPSPSKKKDNNGTERVKADSTTDAAAANDSKTGKNNSKSSALSQSNLTAADSSGAFCLNGTDASAAQYQSYMQSQAALYQMAYGAYSSYPYLSSVPATYGPYGPEMAYAAYSAYNYQMYPQQNMYSMYGSSARNGADQYQMNYGASVKDARTTAALGAPTRGVRHASPIKRGYSCSNAKTSGASESQWVNASPLNCSSDVDFRSYLLNITKPSCTASYVCSATNTVTASKGTSNATSNVITSYNNVCSSSHHQTPTEQVVPASANPASSCEATGSIKGPVNSTPKRGAQPSPPNLFYSDKACLPAKTCDQDPSSSSTSAKSNDILENVAAGSSCKLDRGEKDPSTMTSGLMSGTANSAADVSNKDGCGVGFPSSSSASQNQSDNVSMANMAYESVSKAVAVLQNFDSLRRSVMTEHRNNGRESSNRRDFPNYDIDGVPLHNGNFTNPNLSSSNARFQNQRIRLQISSENEFVHRPERPGFHSTANGTRHLLKNPEIFNIRHCGPNMEVHGATYPMRGMMSTQRNALLPSPEVVRSEIPHQRVPPTHAPVAPIIVSTVSECNAKPSTTVDTILRPRTAQSECMGLARSQVFKVSNAPSVVKQPVFRAPAIRPDIAAAPRSMQPSQTQLPREPQQLNLMTRAPVINPNIRSRAMVPIVLEAPKLDTSLHGPTNELSRPRQPVLNGTLDLPTGRNLREPEFQTQRQDSQMNNSGVQRSPLEAQVVLAIVTES